MGKADGPLATIYSTSADYVYYHGKTSIIQFMYGVGWGFNHPNLAATVNLLIIYYELCLPACLQVVYRNSHLLYEWNLRECSFWYGNNEIVVQSSTEGK